MILPSYRKCADTDLRGLFLDKVVCINYIYTTSSIYRPGFFLSSRSNKVFLFLPE
jgi:hypothetical protein